MSTTSAAPGSLSSTQIAMWARGKLQHLREQASIIRSASEANPGDRQNIVNATRIDSMLEFGASMVQTTSELLHLCGDHVNPPALRQDWARTSRVLIQDGCEVRFASVKWHHSASGGL